MNTKIPRNLWAVALAAAMMMAGAGLARAGYQDEQNARHLGAIERAFDKYVEDRAIFDGKTVADGVDVRAARRHADTCDAAIAAYQRYYGQVTAKGRSSDRGRAVAARHQRLAPWCQALRTAVDRHAAAAQDRAAAAAQAERGAAEGCRAVEKQAQGALGRNDLYDVLDTWSGARTPARPERIREFRASLDQLAAVCESHPDAVTACKGRGTLQSSATNKRYDQGDVCAPVADLTRTLTDVVMRSAAGSAVGASRDSPSVDGLRHRDGWLHSTEPVAYATAFDVPAERKQRLSQQVSGMFVEAGLPVPDDLSSLWAAQTDWYAELKRSVDQLAGSWKLDGQRCSGRACSLVKREVKEAHPRARIVKVTMDGGWTIVKKPISGRPDYQHNGFFVEYQLPGEPYCQVRSFTVREQYDGRKYRAARGAEWGYVRFQTCK